MQIDDIVERVDLFSGVCVGCHHKRRVLHVFCVARLAAADSSSHVYVIISGLASLAYASCSMVDGPYRTIARHHSWRKHVVRYGGRTTNNYVLRASCEALKAISFGQSAPGAVICLIIVAPPA